MKKGYVLSIGERGKISIEEHGNALYSFTLELKARGNGGEVVHQR
jgi:hypothetical protein